MVNPAGSVRSKLGSSYLEPALTLTTTISQEFLDLTIAANELAQKSLVMLRVERGPANFIMRDQCLHCEVPIIARELLQFFRDRFIGTCLRQMSATLCVTE
jgi:hypothetical protein